MMPASRFLSVADVGAAGNMTWSGALRRHPFTVSGDLEEPDPIDLRREEWGKAKTTPDTLRTPGEFHGRLT